MINGPGGMQYAVAEQQTRQGGDWFFWVAGLSLANTLLRVMHAPFGFFFSLGVSGYAARMGGGLPAYLTVTVVASAIIALCGLFARRGARWAFLAGMTLYVLDAFVCLLIPEYLEIAAHAYALYRIFQGFQAAGQLAALRAQSASTPYGGYVPPPSTPPTDVWPPPPSA
jgi:hypothetical protein